MSLRSICSALAITASVSSAENARLAQLLNLQSELQDGMESQNSQYVDRHYSDLTYSSHEAAHGVHGDEYRQRHGHYHAYPYHYDRSNDLEYEQLSNHQQEGAGYQEHFN